ncbi:MAG: hypothetical protein WC299_15255, partial [Kiritimatiellia bacterium]
MKNKARIEAEHFLNNEKQFHLGVLPTEQSNPKTKNIDRTFKAGLEGGVQNLLAVDYDVAAMAARVLAGAEFGALVESGVKCLEHGGRIVFSGCGATGRLSILLESMWRGAAGEISALAPYADRVFSIMTGG